MWDVQKIFVHVRKIFVHVRRKNFFPSYVDKKFSYVDKKFSYVLALAIKLVYKSSASTYEKNLSTYEGKFCPSDVVYFCSEFTKSLRNLKIEFSPYKMGQNTCNFFKIRVSEKCSKSTD